MIEIITEKVKMPEFGKLRYKKDFTKNKWAVIDTVDNSVRYKGEYEMVCIACHNLNKKYYRDIS